MESTGIASGSGGIKASRIVIGDVVDGAGQVCTEKAINEPHDGVRLERDVALRQPVLGKVLLQE